MIAESIATSFAGGQVVSNQIAVTPLGSENAAKAVNSDVDGGIEKNLNAALIRNKLHESVKYAVKNSVVTLTGEVDFNPDLEAEGKAENLAGKIQKTVGRVEKAFEK